MCVWGILIIKLKHCTFMIISIKVINPPLGSNTSFAHFEGNTCCPNIEIPCSEGRQNRIKENMLVTSIYYLAHDVFASFILPDFKVPIAPN